MAIADFENETEEQYAKPSLLDSIISQQQTSRPPIALRQRIAIARNINNVERQLLQEADRAGESFVYGWGIGTNRIEGASIKLAMAMARCWGNCAIAALPVQETHDAWIFTACFIDHETGFTLERQFRQSKRHTVHGKHDESRKEDMRFAIGQSKAARNVVLSTLPEWLKDKAMEQAKEGNGFVLCWYSEVHYRLLHKASAAIFDLYPGNQRIYRVRGKWHINGLPSDWTLKTSPANWAKRLKWNRQAEQEGVRKRVFCASLADEAQARRKPKGEPFDLTHLAPQDWSCIVAMAESAAKRNSVRDLVWFAS